MTLTGRLAIGVALLLLPAADASAQQTGAPTPLRLETDRLQQAPGAAPSAVGELGDARAVAMLQSRILAMEEQLRRLTGRVEEAEHREAQTRDRIDRLVADLDRRLGALEQQTQAALAADGPTSGGPGGATPGASARTALPETLTAEEPDAEPPDAEPLVADDPPVVAETPEVTLDPAARDGYVLGTIPRDAVLSIPEPGQNAPSGTAPRSALEGSAPARFSAALDLLQNGDYGAAEVAFSRWLADYPDASRAPEAAYWIGEAQLAREAYADAAASFAGNYSTYGADAPRAADNLLKLGAALAAVGDTTRACQAFAEMNRRYPNVSPALQQALQRERRAAGCS